MFANVPPGAGTGPFLFNAPAAPLDGNGYSLDLVRLAIAQLYAPTATPTAHNEAQTWLLAFQASPAAWGIARSLLADEIFGALTMQIKISRDWQTLSPTDIEPLRQELVARLVQSAAGPPFVTTKICTALAAFAFKAVPESWPRPVHSLCQDFRAQMSSATATPSQRVALELALLDFFTVLPEEMQKAVFTPDSRKHRFQVEVQQDAALALEMALTVLRTELVEGTGEDERNVVIALKKKGLLCVLSWANLHQGIPFE
ncbi:hypothetical protein DFJ73DRAFT_902752 [Zopfochytrium polystomum]|nr:hypothetical protein DFJ73DRAFT_902752 [Zopfochytrium polystomum]